MESHYLERLSAGRSSRPASLGGASALPGRRLWIPGLPDVLPLLRRGAARVRDWMRNARQRAVLARLDDRLLRDMGLDRATAHEEARKWFWQG